MPKRQVNWTYQGKEILNLDDMPAGVLGVIYKIYLLDGSETYYIGRKTVNSKRKKRLTKKEKELPENTRKTFKYVEVESAWKKYTGSSKALNEVLKKSVKYEKEIIKYCFSKAEMTYSETAEIICSNALLDDKCFNFWVSARIYKKHLNKDI